MQMMVDRGDLTPEVAKSYPGKNLITRAIGTEPLVMCDIYHKEVNKGDYLLLCTDGLVDTVSDQEMLFEILQCLHQTPSPSSPPSESSGVGSGVGSGSGVSSASF